MHTKIQYKLSIKFSQLLISLFSVKVIYYYVTLITLILYIINKQHDSKAKNLNNLDKVFKQIDKTKSVAVNPGPIHPTFL